MEDFFYRHNDATIIRYQGEDAEDYLQSQWSIDIRKLGKGGVRFGLRLNLKGKILAGAYIARLKEEEFPADFRKYAGPGHARDVGRKCRRR